MQRDPDPPQAETSTDSMFILGSLWPLSMLSLEDKNSCLFMSENKGCRAGGKATRTQLDRLVPADLHCFSKKI